jgi:hypothetical protein
VVLGLAPGCHALVPGRTLPYNGPKPGIASCSKAGMTATLRTAAGLQCATDVGCCTTSCQRTEWTTSHTATKHVKGLTVFR